MMDSQDFRFGFRIIGKTWEPRRSVDWAAAFRAYCECDERADMRSEAFLSAFSFGLDFHGYLNETRRTAGFDGPCWAPWVWWDIDRENDLEAARRDAVGLAVALTERYRLDDDAMLIFTSGSKGFHVGLPTALFAPIPSAHFNSEIKQFAVAMADIASVQIDGGVYDKVRPFRAPNSRHPKTGRYKRRFGLDELMHLKLESILQRSNAPEPFDIPDAPDCCDQTIADWQTAIEAARHQGKMKSERQAAAIENPKLNRQTLDFICNGATKGDRHRLLFSAAANLAEFGCPPALAHELLTDAARDSGLTSSEIHRQIDCGLQQIQGNQRNE